MPPSIHPLRFSFNVIPSDTQFEGERFDTGEEAQETVEKYWSDLYGGATKSRCALVSIA